MASVIFDPILRALRTSDGSGGGDVSELTDRIDALEAAVTALEQGSAADVHVENFRFIYAASPDNDKLRLEENFLQEKFTHQGVYHIILYNAAGNSQNAGVLYVSPGQNRLHQVLIYTLDARVYVYSRRILWTEWAKLATGEYTGFDWIKTQIAGQNTAWESDPVVNPEYNSGNEEPGEPDEPEEPAVTYLDVDPDTVELTWDENAEEQEEAVVTIETDAASLGIDESEDIGGVGYRLDGSCLVIVAEDADPHGTLIIHAYDREGTEYSEFDKEITITHL